MNNAQAGDPRGSAVRLVRDAGSADVVATADLHVRELSDGLFPGLGVRFMRAYHATFVDSPHAVALVAVTDGQVQGMLLAVVDPAAHGSVTVRRFGPRLLLAGALALSVRPRLLTLFLQTRLRRYARALWRRRNATPDSNNGDASWAVLSHLAVEPVRRGRGDGAALVEALHARLTETAVSGVVLVTAPDGPGSQFYRRIGYVEDGQVVGADRKHWVRYRRRLD